MPDFVLLDKKGNIIENGRLEENPYFVRALELVPTYSKSPGFQQLAMTAADFQAANSALNAGSKPENLVMSPMMAFMEPPVPGAIQHAQELIKEYLERGDGNMPANSKNKDTAAPWWKFWKK
jgi:hypothetical protein